LSIFPTTVLLAIDGSTEASLATEAAVEITIKTRSELHLVYVRSDPLLTTLYEGEYLGGVQDLDLEFDEELENARRAAQELLDAAVRKVHSLGGAVAQAHLMEGRAPQEIVSLAEDSGIGVIVMGSRGRGGLSRTLMGSVSDSVVRHAHCPVLVVRAYQEGEGHA
jgi:nucleotide-binding universal stress UspA family protein